MKGTIFDIERASYVDGPGIRTTVFFKGCNLRCAWCHNPESQSAKPQMMLYRELCTGCGKCKEICQSPDTCTLCGRCPFYCPADARKVCGKEYTADEVFEEIIKDKAYYDYSGGGVTFSGGECMLQIGFLQELLQKCKAAGIHTAVDTAGAVPFDAFAQILPYTDLFLYDIKLMDEEKHQKYIGAPNDRILANLERLFEQGAKVWVRVPVIGGVNDTAGEMQKIKDFLQNRAEKVELLPYHAMGENKYPALGMDPQTFTAPAKERMDELKTLFMR